MGNNAVTPRLPDPMPKFIAALLCLLALAAPRFALAVPRDVVLVVDNSGSMKHNDPGFLAKRAVEEFIGRLDGETRAQIIIFDEKVDVAVPFTAVTDESRATLLASLSRINYRGKFTNSPAAVERAIFDLKAGARPGAEKAIVFITDGIVDTGDKALDVEKARWLREDVTADAAEHGIRIFAIAYTDNADFMLIQSLARRTKGEYFRAAKAEDLAGVFASISESIAKPPVVEAPPPPAPPVQAPLPPPPAPVVITPPPPPPPPHSSPLLLVAVGLGAATVVLLLVLVFRRRSASAGAAAPVARGSVPRAYLNDIHRITSDPAYEIGAKPVMLGRAAGADRNLDYIVVAQTTVGRAHALIEYKDFAFRIIDQGSVNGTFVNGERIDGEHVLKHGDRIRLHNFEFEFVMPDMADSGRTVFVGQVPGDIGERTLVASAAELAAPPAARAAPGGVSHLDNTAPIPEASLAGAGDDDDGFIDLTAAPVADPHERETIVRGAPPIDPERETIVRGAPLLDPERETIVRSAPPIDPERETIVRAGPLLDPHEAPTQVPGPRQEPGDVTLESFMDFDAHEAATQVRPTEPEASLDSFISTAMFDATPKAVPARPDDHSEDPTLMPEAPPAAAPAAAPAAEPSEDATLMPEFVPDAGASRGAPVVEDEAELSLDEFVQSTVMTTSSALEAPDDDRTLMPSEVEIPPRKP